jgi:hypothetical protein
LGSCFPAPCPRTNPVEYGAVSFFTVHYARPLEQSQSRNIELEMTCGTVMVHFRATSGRGARDGRGKAEPSCRVGKRGATHRDLVGGAPLTHPTEDPPIEGRRPTPLCPGHFDEPGSRTARFRSLPFTVPTSGNKAIPKTPESKRLAPLRHLVFARSRRVSLEGLPTLVLREAQPPGARLGKPPGPPGTPTLEQSQYETMGLV